MLECYISLNNSTLFSKKSIFFHKIVFFILKHVYFKDGATIKTVNYTVVDTPIEDTREPGLSKLILNTRSFKNFEVRIRYNWCSCTLAYRILSDPGASNTMQNAKVSPLFRVTDSKFSWSKAGPCCGLWFVVGGCGWLLCFGVSIHCSVWEKYYTGGVHTRLFSVILITYQIEIGFLSIQR